MSFPVVVLTLAVLIGLQALLIRLAGRRGFAYRRDFSQDLVTRGERLEFVETISNNGPLFLPWVRLEMSVPVSFLFVTEEDIDARGRNYYMSVFSLPPFSRVTRRHQVVPARRGHYRLSQASVTAGDLLGFYTRSGEVDAPAELFVAPELLDESEAALPASGAVGTVSVRRLIQPDPFLVDGIRDYRPGDPVRDIHWPASARMPALQVRTHGYSADPRLLVLINGQKTESQGGSLMEYEQDRLEYAVSLAATLCVCALRHGLEAGFAASLPLDDADECACLLPGRGPGREEMLMRAFACLEMRLVRSFTTFLENLPTVSGTDIVILSCYDSEAIQTQMNRLRALGNSVSLRLLPEVPHA